METTTHAKHPNYLLIGAALIVLTLFEVAAVYLPVPTLLFLIIFGAAKALLIVMFFMHLRFDSRLYSLLFTIGVAGGIAMVTILITIFQAMWGT